MRFIGCDGSGDTRKIRDPDSGSRGVKVASRYLATLRGALPILGLTAMLASAAEAALTVTVINQTGYDLAEVKYVEEAGAARRLAGTTRRLAHNGSYNFVVDRGGTYRIYAAFLMGRGKRYAKGSANRLEDGGRYRLTLKKVNFDKSGAGLSFIGQGEFDAIK